MREAGNRSRLVARVTYGFAVEILVASLFAGMLVTCVSILAFVIERG